MRAYLQISCAGLGFDIGELWWTSNKDSGSTSALAAIGMLRYFLFTFVSSPKKILQNSFPVVRLSVVRFIRSFDWTKYV